MHPRSIHVCCDAGCAQLLRTERPRAALLPLGALHVAVFIARDALSVWCALLPFGVAYPRLVCPALRLVCAAVCLVWPALHLVWLTGARSGAFLGFCSCEPHPIKTEAHQTGGKHTKREFGNTKRRPGTPNARPDMPTSLLARASPGSLAGEGLLTGASSRTGLAYRGPTPYRPCLPGPAVHPPRLREALAALPRLAALLAQGVVAALELIERKGVQLGWVDLAVLGEHGLVG